MKETASLCPVRRGRYLTASEWSLKKNDTIFVSTTRIAILTVLSAGAREFRPGRRQARRRPSTSAPLRRVFHRAESAHRRPVRLSSLLQSSISRHPYQLRTGRLSFFPFGDAGHPASFSTCL